VIVIDGPMMVITMAEEHSSIAIALKELKPCKMQP